MKRQLQSCEGLVADIKKTIKQRDKITAIAATYLYDPPFNLPPPFLFSLCICITYICYVRGPGLQLATVDYPTHAIVDCSSSPCSEYQCHCRIGTYHLGNFQLSMLQ